MKKRLLSLLLCAMCVLAAHSEVQYILNEGFESGIPATWTQQTLSTNTQNWVAENSELSYPNGAFEGTGRVALRNTTGTTMDYVTRLITPVLNLSAGSQYELKFAYATAAWSGSVDSLTVYYSTDGGAQWIVHTGFGTVQNSWKEVTLDLIGNGSNYQLAFEAYDRLGRGVVLDAVRVLAKSKCANVENFAADAHANSVDLSWNGDFDATFQLIVDTVSHALTELDPAGSYLHYEATTNDMVNVSGLLPEHTYYAYVRSLCDDNESGFTEWQAVEFRTAIGFPYQANLSSMPAGWQIMYGALDAQPQPNPSASYTWFQTSSAAFGAHVYGLTYYSYSGGAQYLPDWFISPAIDISSLTEGSPIELTFNLSISSYSTLMTDLTSNQGTSNFYVMVSTDGGESWSEAKVCPATTYASAWRRVRVNLTEYTGVASSVKVALVAHSSSTSVYFHVKDIKIDSFDAQCGDVQSIGATDITTTSAKLVWSLLGKDDIVLEVSKNANFASLLSSDTLSLASHELLLSSLDNSTTYYVRAKQLCEDAEWVFGSFTTLFGMPFSENFDALTAGIPAGWDNSEGTMTTDSYKWNYFDTGRTGNCVRLNSYSASNGQYNVLATPIIVVDDVDCKFSFDYKNATGGPLEVFYSVDNGVTRVALDSLGNASSWETHTYTLPATVRNIGVQFFFKGTSNWGSGDAYLHIDNVMLKEYDPNCLGLVSLVANAEINDAVISWAIGGSTHEALVLVSSQANFSDTVVLAAVSGVDTLLVEGLEANTKYYVRAIQNCGGFTMADALSLNFKTHCEADTIPYIMGFEDEISAQDPNCWTIVRKSGSYPYAYQGASYAHDGTKSFYYGSGAAQPRSTAALPAFDQPVNGLEMSFWLRAYSASCTNTLEVGVMTNPLDTTTFVRIASFQPKNTTYEQQTVSFNSYQGNGKYIAFRNAATGSYGFCIDDIDVHVLPACFRVGEIEITEVTDKGAKLNFAPTNADNYQVVVATKAIDIDSLHLDSIAALVVYNQVVNDTTGMIVLDDETAFEGNTTYYVYMRGVCSETELGAWGAPVVFTTNCRPFTPAEFGTETFDNAANMACWKFGFTTEGTSSSSAKAQRTANLSKFGNVIQLTKESANSTSYTYSDGAYAITPEFNVGDTINKYQIAFSAATNNSTSATNVHKLTIAIATSQGDLSDKEDIVTVVLPYAADSTGLKDYAISLEDYQGSEASGLIGRYVMFQSVARDSTNYVVIDNVRLEPISNCKKVNEVAISAITSEGATFSWENVGATQYEVFVSTINTKDVDTISVAAFIDTVSSTSLVITGLEGNAQYYAYVRSICGEGEASLWSSAVAFHTECDAVAVLPWSENFDGMAKGNSSSPAPECWALINANDGNYPYIFVNNSSSYVKSGSQSLYFQSSSSRAGIVVLPSFEEPINNLLMSFACKFESASSSGKLYVGYVTDINDAASFDTIAEVTRMTTWQDIKVDFMNVPVAKVADARIALMYAPQSSNYFLGIDDIVVDVLPSCVDPKNITVSEVTTSSATIKWEGSSPAYNLYVAMGADTVASFEGISADSVQVTGLQPSSTYAVSLQGLCGNDSSAVVTTIFSTNLGIPYVENLSTKPSKWFYANTKASDVFSGTPMTSTTAGWASQTTSTPQGMGANMKLNIFGTSCKYWMVTPAIDMTDPSLGLVQLSFDAAWTKYGSADAPTQTSTDDMFLVAVSLDGGATWSDTCAYVWANDGTGNMGTVDQIPATATKINIDLSSYVGNTIAIGFYGESTVAGGDNDFHVANVSVREMIAGCDDPTEVAISLLGQDTAVVTWAGDSAKMSVIRLAYDDEFTQIALVDTVAAGLVDTILNLAHGVKYYAQVMQLCDESAKTAYANASSFITTPCDPEAAMPWSIDFASATSSEFPVCWTVVKEYKSSVSTYPYVSTVSGAIYMYGGSSTSDQMIALPEFTTPLNKLTLTMQYQASVTSSSKYGDLVIGTLDETMAESSFVALATLPQTASKTDFELVLSAAPATAKYLAIRYADGTSYGTAYVYKMALDITPSCLPLKKLEAKNVERRSMDIVWTPKAESDSYDLVISTVALTDSALNVAEKISLDTTAYHVEGLTRNTTYYVYVRANCGAEDGVGAWSAISQKTASLQDCYDLAIADGTTTSEYYPFYGYYADMGFWTQMIYPESMLTDLVGSDLNSLKFYISSGDVSSWTTAEFQISMATTTSGEYLSTTDITGNTDLTLVYEGSVSAQDNVMTINFTTPFHYDGGNLVIDVYETVGGGYGYVYFKGVTTTGNQAFYTTDFATIYTSKFLPKVSFTKCVESDPCPTVATVSHELLGDGTSSARISWTASAGDYANSYSVVYADSLITDWENVVPQIDSIQALDTVISGLEAYTDYYVYVIAHCDAEGQNDGSSVWSEAYHFKTLSSCLVVEDLSFVATGKTTAQATWSAPYADKNFVYVLSTELLDAAALEAATPVAHTDTVLNLESLQFDQTYYLYVAHNCGEEGLSPYLMDSIHTSASCPAVANLHAVNTTANTVTLAWNHAAFGEETEWEVGVVGRESVAQVVTDSSAFIIGLDADMDYTVYVKAICSETEQSALATLAIHTPEMSADEQAIGSGSGTSSSLPGNLYYKYATSMQIYTSEEIGKAGMITSLSLKYLSSTAANNRDLTIYLKHVTRSTFSGTTDWEVMDASEEVFNGRISYVSGDWTTIELDSPFDYNGTDNLLLVVDDNTGSYVGSSLYFASYTTSNYQALYYQSDGTNLDPTNPTQSGTRTSSKNQILLGFEPQACPAVKTASVSDVTATSAHASWLPGAGEVSWAVVLSDSALTDAQLAVVAQDTLTYKMDTLFSALTPDVDYHFYIRPICSSAEADWKHVAFTTLPTCLAPVNLVAKAMTDSSAVLTWSNLTPDFTGSYEIAVGPAATFDLAVDTTYTLYNATDTTRLVKGLEAQSSYKFAVREHCSDQDQSRWSAVYTFRTECGAYDVPFAEDFENADMTCWSLDDGVSVAYNSSYAQSGTYALQFNKTNATVLAVLPSFKRNLSELEFSYAWRCEGTGSYSTMGYLEAGYVTDPNDASTFVQLLNHPEHVYSYESAEVLFPANVPDNARPAFRYSGQTASWYLFVDDVLVREKPNCSKPLLTAVDATPNTITIAFEDTANYVVEMAYDATFTRRYDSLYVAQADTFEITGLPAATTFYIRAQRVCEADMRSDWSASLKVATGCLPVTAFPWVEDFNAYAAGDYERACVDNIVYQESTESGYGSTGKLFAIYTSTQYDNSTPKLQLPDMKVGSLTRLYLPEMVFDTASLYEFSMDIYRASASSKTNEGIRLFVVDAAGVERELTFISRDFATAGALVPAETKADWYTYTFSMPNDGGTYRIMLQGESQYGLSTYMDNFMVQAKNANCLGVSDVVVSNISLAGADLAFNYLGGAADAVVELATVADFNTVLVSDTIAGDSIYHFANLSASTTYYVRVKQICGEGEESAYTVTSFTTNYGVRYAPVFASTTLPSDWSLAGGKMDDVIAGRADLTTSSKWSLVAKSAALDAVHFKANVYGTSTSDWFITPSIDLSPNAQDGLLLTFDAALTDWGNNNAPEAKDRTDDRFAVVAIVDDTVFTKVAEWNNTGDGDYVYSEIDSVATPYMVDMTAFAGLSNVRLGFYCESTVSGADDDLHIGNIVLDRKDAVNYISDICEGEDYDGAAEGNPFYIHSTEYTIGENRFVKVVGDSICILSLTAYPAETEEYSVTVCEGDSYQDEYFNLTNITLQTNTEQMNRNQTTEHGCTKTVLMHLTINPKQKTVEQATICAGDTLDWNGKAITTSGNYTFETQSVVTGCDSTVTLAVRWGEINREERDTLLHEGETFFLSDGTPISEAGDYEDDIEPVEGECSHTIIWHVDIETAIINTREDALAEKRMINGRLVIIKNGAVYSAQGARLE